MKRIKSFSANPLAMSAVVALFLVSLSSHAGGLGSLLKESLNNVAGEVKESLEYSVDQALRNTFPALSKAGDAEDAPEGFNNNEVLLFGFKSCPYCTKVEKLLRRNRVVYIDMDVQKSKKAKRKFREMGGRGVPVTVIGDKAIAGWSEEKIMDLLKEKGFI